MEVANPFDDSDMSDGAISAFRIHNGHVDFQRQYVKTDRYMAETKHRRNLFGRYRNPFTGTLVCIFLS
jgi:carotenoid cleavage dioxygenase-like enzyme